MKRSLLSSSGEASSSIKRRLVTGLFCVSIVVMLLAGKILHRRFDTHLLGHFDHSLSDKARLIRASCDFVDGLIKLQFDQGYLDRINDPHDPEFFLVRRINDGAIVFQSANMEVTPFPFPGLEEVGYRNVLDTEGREVRFLAEVFHPRDDPGAARLHLVVGHHLSRVAEDRREIGKILWQVGLAITAALLLSIFWVLRRNLAPLLQLQHQIESARPDEHRRFDVGRGAPAEVDAITKRLNILMNRVEESIRAEREFSGMAAHELRTPLAGIRGIAERGIPDGRFAEILRIESDLETLVENLLLVSRTNSGGIPVALELERPSRIVAQAWSRYFERAEEAGIAFRLASPEGEAEMSLPVQLLRIVFLNLLGNALEYTGKGGVISASVQVSEKRVLRFVIENTPITTRLPDDLDSLKRAFRRGEPIVEVGEIRHSGLGLLICERIMVLLEGKLDLRSIDGASFRVEIEFPTENSSSRSSGNSSE